MVAPVVKIAFDLSLAGAGNFFTIGETVLGSASPSLPLVGDALVDVSEDVRSVSVRRGRSRETDKFDAGTATVVVANEDRLYDPNNDLSPYAPSLVPRKELVVEAAGQTVFTGQVEDIDLTYSMDRRSDTVFKAADGISLLSRLNVSASAVSAQLTGARVSTILTDASWPTARRDIDTGKATLASASIAPETNVIEYLNRVAASEPGFVFIDREGTFRFNDRASTQILTDYVFGDQPGDLRFSALELEYGTEKLHTRIEIEWASGTATAENLPAQVLYGIDTLTVQTLLSTGGQAAELAEFYATRYGAPQVRVRGLEIAAHAYSATDLGRLLSLELGALVQFRFTPNGVGSPIEQGLIVESIEHSFNPGSHIIRLSLSEGQPGFILDSDRLDFGRLGF